MQDRDAVVPVTPCPGCLCRPCHRNGVIDVRRSGSRKVTKDDACIDGEVSTIGLAEDVTASPPM